MGVLIALQEFKLGIRYQRIPDLSTDRDPLDTDCGFYLPDRETIYLHAINDSSCDAREIIHHELGHFYVHSLAKEHGLINSYLYKTATGDLALRKRLVTEGIAEYFFHRMVRGFDPESYHYAENWPTTLLDWHQNKYGLGFKLVEPILDVNVNKGIEYLLRHPPDLKNVVKYQQRGIEWIIKNS